MKLYHGIQIINIMPSTHDTMYACLENGQFICKYCGEIKKHQSTMYYHIQKHTKTMFSHQCQLCKKGFLMQSTLNLHMTSRHPLALSSVLECPIKECTFKAYSKGNYRIHVIRSHFQDIIQQILQIDNTAIQQYTCKKCLRTFNSDISFYYHCTSHCIQLPTNDSRIYTLNTILT